MLIHIILYPLSFMGQLHNYYLLTVISYLENLIINFYSDKNYVLELKVILLVHRYTRPLGGL